MAVVRARIAGGAHVSAAPAHGGAVPRFVALGVAAVGTMAATAMLLGMPTASVAAGAGSLAAALVVCAVGMHRTHPHARLGAANVVTLVRLTIVGLLLSILLAGGAHATAGHATTIVALGVVALCLDGVDGRLARRQGLASRFGAAFDMEVDSAFALVLSVLAAFGPAGPLALVLGLPRYVFGVAELLAPWLNAPLAPRFSRKAVCVVQLIALIALQLPFLPPWAALTLVALAAGLVAWSFGLDIARLSRSRQGLPATRAR